jgi:hypothetical protein
MLGHRRRGDIIWCEIGLVYAGAVTLYGAYPLVGFLVLGQSYTPLNDNRLQQMSPAAQEMGRIGWFYAAHLTAFVLGYIAVRGRLPLRTPVPPPPRLSVALAAAGFYVAIQAFSLVVGWFYDTSASTYLESYLIAKRLPLIVAQLLNHLSSAKYPLAIVLQVILFTRYPGSRPILLAWLLFAAGTTAIRLGSRTEFALLAFAAAMVYHSFVRRISTRLITTAAVLGVIAFVAFGIWRSGLTDGGGRPWYATPFTHSSEFEVLFTNGLHLDRLQQQGVDFGLPPAFYFGGLANILPQQFAPYTKVDAAAWYVSTFFPAYAAAGGGLAFGVVAESLLTGGWWSAMARGAILGVFFAGIHRLYVHRGRSLWVFVFYVWVTTLSYQSVRATTLFLAPLFVYQFIVVMVTVKITETLLNLATRSRIHWHGTGHPAVT